MHTYKAKYICRAFVNLISDSDSDSSQSSTPVPASLSSGDENM